MSDPRYRLLVPLPLRLELPTAVFTLEAANPVHHWRAVIWLQREGEAGRFEIRTDLDYHADPRTPFTIFPATVPHTVLEALCRRGQAERL